jgi:hypothetical protein
MVIRAFDSKRHLNFTRALRYAVIVLALVVLCKAPSSADDTAIVKGHVYAIYAGTSLAHVKVRLATFNDHWYEETNTEKTTETSAAGNYVFVGVSPGRHIVIAGEHYGGYHTIWPFYTPYMQPGDVAVANIALAPWTLIVDFYSIPTAPIESATTDRYVLRSTQVYAGGPRLVSNVPGVR